jgi:hypothetical protein
MGTSFVIELRGSAVEVSTATLEGIPVPKLAADGEKDDTVPSISPLPVSLIESISGNVTMTAARPAILCRIAHIATHSLASRS